MHRRTKRVPYNRDRSNDNSYQRDYVVAADRAYAQFALARAQRDGRVADFDIISRKIGALGKSKEIEMTRAQDALRRREEARLDTDIIRIMRRTPTTTDSAIFGLLADLTLPEKKAQLAQLAKGRLDLPAAAPALLAP